MSRLLGLLVGVLSGWLGVMSFGAAVAAPVSPVAVYTYDGQESCAADCSDSSERGPPVHASSASTPGAVDRGSRRTSARLALPTTGAAATIYYDATSMLVQVAHATATTQGHPHGAEAALSSITRSDVAAKTVDDLPTVNWGQQSKHFPGHPNFIPGRSTLTANPEALIQRAGNGTPVGSVPRGQAGFKERIDFGDGIGTYVSRDGTSSPTSIGILHYRADGSVRIIPGRPQ